MIFWKNRGILVLVYLGVPMLGWAFLLGYLQRNIGGIFEHINFNLVASFGFWTAGIWTYIVKDDFYKNDMGEKVKLNTINDFYFISLKYWAFIFWLLGFIFLGLMILEMP